MFAFVGVIIFHFGNMIYVYGTVVRPNHYLQQGTFGKEQHLLPNSFYTPGQQVGAELRNLKIAAPPQQQKQGVQSSAASQQQNQRVQGTAASEQVSRTSPSNAEPAQDSYANIGGQSGNGIASALTNIHEYGETVPPAFSSLQQDSYAYYHGHQQQA